MYIRVNNLADLQDFLQFCSDGVTCDVLAPDLKSGNFEVAHFMNNGVTITLTYVGPVAEGYVSPFEMELTPQEVYQIAYEYAKNATQEGFSDCSQEQEEWYQENVRHVGLLEDAYARGAYAGIDDVLAVSLVVVG
jgi:hypothetical protein